MKYWIHVVFILLITPFGFSQKVHVNLSVDQNEIEVGTPIIITVTYNVKGDITIDFPPNFKALPGVSSGMNKQIDYHSGKSETVYFVTRKGSFQDNGKYNFSAKLKTRKQTYTSNSVTVRVQKHADIETIISQKDTKKPVFGKVEVNKKIVYEGESVLVNAKIFTKYDLAVESYEPFKVNGYPEVKDLVSPKETIFTPVTINGQQYFQTPFDKKLLFFSAPGQYEVEAFKMGIVYETSEDYINYEVNSNKEIIEVLPLPASAPIHFTGGIGEFKLTRKFDDLEIKQGDVVVMTVEIEGEGNVHNIGKPEFVLPTGVIQYGDPEITLSINYNTKGAKGKKIYKFHLQFLEKGDFNISPMEMSFFNPKEKRYITLKSPAVVVKALKSSNFQNQLVDNSEDLVLENESSESDNPSDGKSKSSKGTVLLLGVFLPIGLAGFLFLFIRRKPKKDVDQSAGIIEEAAVIKEMDEKEQIQILQEESSYFQLEGNFKVSFEKLESSIRMMLVFVTEDAGKVIDRENLLQHLSASLVACETARFLGVYDREELIKVQVSANSIFNSIKSQMN